ncbi:hypothetical protein pb186bvf_005961 [Paramecium bursaria]
MDSDQVSVGSKFNFQRRQVENDINTIRVQNDELQRQESITQEQSKNVKEYMKSETSRIQNDIETLQKQARGDQKMIVKQLRQQFTKQVERHIAILRQLVKQSFAQNFDTLQLKESNAQGVSSESYQKQFFLDQKISSQHKSLQRQESFQELVNQPLLDTEEKRISNDSQSSGPSSRDTREAQLAEDLNKLLLLQDVENHKKELDNLIIENNEQDKSKCIRVSIIVTFLIFIIIVLAVAGYMIYL